MTLQEQEAAIRAHAAAAEEVRRQQQALDPNAYAAGYYQQPHQMTCALFSDVQSRVMPSTCTDANAQPGVIPPPPMPPVDVANAEQQAAVGQSISVPPPPPPQFATTAKQSFAVKKS